MNKKFSTLIIGCKKHEEIAKRFYDLTNLLWPEILDDVVFCTDEVTDYQMNFSKGNMVCEPNQKYSDRIKKGLSKIESDYVLLLLDDYYFTKKINATAFDELMSEIRKNDINYCKLIGLPKCFSKYKAIKHTHRIKKQTHYGVSLQPSIWKKDALLEALSLCTGSSAWEVEGAFSSYQEKYYSSCITFNKNYLSIKNGVVRGKVTPGTNKMLKKNGVDILDIEKIPYFKYKAFMLKQHVAMHLPVFIRKFGKKIGMRVGKKYYTDN